MELVKRIIELVDVNLIYCLIPIILTLLLIDLIFKDRFETKKALNVIRWVIISYSIISLIYLLSEAMLYPEETKIFDDLGRSILYLFSALLPFTLLNKRLASRYLYVLLVAVFMKFGFYFERFIIIATTYQRDFSTESMNEEWINLLWLGMAMPFVQGVMIALLLLMIFEGIKWKRKMK